MTGINKKINNKSNTTKQEYLTTYCNGWRIATNSLSKTFKLPTPYVKHEIKTFKKLVSLFLIQIFSIIES